MCLVVKGLTRPVYQVPHCNLIAKNFPTKPDISFLNSSAVHFFTISLYISNTCNAGWGLKTKSWWIDSAIAKFIAFGHTFAMKIIFSPQKRFSSPWVFVWKPENPHYGVKNKSCRKLHIWVSKPIRRKIQNQWKKLELNRAYQLREKSKKTPEMSLFWKTVFSGGFLDFSLNW